MHFIARRTLCNSIQYELVQLLALHLWRRAPSFRIMSAKPLLFSALAVDQCVLIAHKQRSQLLSHTNKTYDMADSVNHTGNAAKNDSIDYTDSTYHTTTSQYSNSASQGAIYHGSNFTSPQRNATEQPAYYGGQRIGEWSSMMLCTKLLTMLG